MSAHVGDDAELYALGVLAQSERDAIDAHLATCATCSRAVARAERVIAALSDIQWEARAPVARSARVTVRAALVATAAAFALSIGLGGLLAVQNATSQSVRRDDDLAFATLATSHFSHASFVARMPHAPPAKVLYARDGAWLYVVVAGAAEGDRVIAIRAGKPIVLGIVRARSQTSVAFVRPAQRERVLELRDPRGGVVASVALTYPQAGVQPSGKPR